MIADDSNYLKYRGKCRELCELAVENNPTLVIKRGYYHDTFWGRQEHFWCIDEHGLIHDPSKLQFPDQNGEYEEFNGFYNCEQCGRSVPEVDVKVYGSYVFCSHECVFQCVI